MSRGSRGTLFALLAVLALLTSACGSRLTKEERAQAISALTGGGGGTGTGGTGTGTGSDTGSESTGGGGDTSSGGGSTGSASTGGGGGGGGGSGSSSGGGGGGGTGGAAGAKSCAKATKNTDTGATANKLTIATLADISGVQPGLFQSAHQAASAAAAYINSTGGICGRAVDPMLLDSKTSAGGNRAAMLDACSKAFAVVGSMSAFDDGSAKPGQECGIPDISAVTTNLPKYNATNTFPAYPNGPKATSNTGARYIAKAHPQAVKKAAILWLAQAVTRNNAVNRENVWKSVGFKFVYKAEVQVLEANYTRFVSAMQDAGVDYVTMVADFQNIVRLQKTMRQQGFEPEVRDWDSVAYDPDYLKEAAVDGSFIFMNTAMFEESGGNPEMKLYLDWLQRTRPGATPDYFGIYAWSAYRLFQKVASEIGPDLTREKMLAALKATKEWNGNGLHGPNQIGAKLPTVCNLHLEAKGGKFTRVHPASGFDCSGTLFRS